MNDLSQEQHALLRDVVVGDRSKDDPAVQLEVRNSPLFAKRLAGLADAGEWLAMAGCEMDETLRVAAELQGSPGESRLHQHVLGDRHGRPTWLDRRRALIAIVAASILAATFALWPDQGSQRQPIMMGDTIRLIRPVGKVSSYSPIRWEGGLPKNGRFEVRIWNAEDWAQGDPPPSRDPVLSLSVTLPEWNLREAELEQLADRVLIAISVLNLADKTERAVLHTAWR